MTRRRHGAALLVTSFLVAQLIGLVHQSGVQHSVCPEHGELIHGRQVAGPWAAPGQRVRGVPQAPGDEHDVCELAVASHERTEPPDPPPAIAQEAEAGREVAPPPARPVRASLALYLTAPKTSPPA
jgi:hypothetical protein